jgi:alpha-1,2-mannosyltransferase
MIVLFIEIIVKTKENGIFIGIIPFIEDTFGFPFTTAFLKVFGFNCITYVHYPFLQDNFGQIHTRKEIYLKTLYFFYESALALQDFIIVLFLSSKVNSKWTYFHIPVSSRSKSIIIYPSVNMMEIERSRENAKRTLISLSQFRPEKEHEKQLEIFEQLGRLLDNTVRFKIIGSCREEDLALFHRIKKMSEVFKVI